MYITIISKFKDLSKGEIKIGASTTLTKLVLMDSLKEFHKDYPKIKLTIKNDLTSNLIKELKQGFIYNPENFEDRVKSFEDLNSLPLILQKEESNSRKLLDHIALKNNVKLVPYMEVVSQELVTEFTNIGFGVGFSMIELAKRKYPSIKELKINKEVPNINVYLVTNKTVSLTFSSKTFIKYLK